MLSDLISFAYNSSSDLDKPTEKSSNLYFRFLNDLLIAASCEIKSDKCLATKSIELTKSVSFLISVVLIVLIYGELSPNISIRVLSRSERNNTIWSI